MKHRGEGEFVRQIKEKCHSELSWDHDAGKHVRQARCSVYVEDEVHSNGL